MIIGVMQPYFIPYIGYWQLMNAVDRYVIYDDVNYINRGWINRNRILLDGQAHYINIPMLGASQNKKINEIEVNHDPKLMQKNLRLLYTAYHKAPYFRDVYPLIEDILCCDCESLSTYIEESFHIINKYIGIDTELIVSSSMDKDCTLKGQDKILHIVGRLNGTDYYNAIGGQKLYSYRAFEEQGITLSFLQCEAGPYEQFGNEFVPNLSIVDVMMFNNRARISEMLNEYRLISGEE